MKTILLLTHEAETARLMLKNIAFDELPVRDAEAHAGCKCDRWGHPCPGCVNRDVVPEAETLVHHRSNSEITKWNTWLYSALPR